jgi:hypothetical protein
MVAAEEEAVDKRTRETQGISSNINNHSHITRRITTITGNKIKTLRTMELVMNLLNIIITRINTPIKTFGSRIVSPSTTSAVAAVELLNNRQTKVITD